MTLHHPLPRTGMTPRREFGPTLAAELAQDLAPLVAAGQNAADRGAGPSRVHHLAWP